MTVGTSPVTVARRGSVAVLTVDNPPVNALSHGVRLGLRDGVRQAGTDAGVAAVVITCAGRTFIAGADITEFGQPLKDPGLHEVLDVIEESPKPVVAAIHGTALGGGLEVALACHWRVGVRTARLGLPEVKLGLLPGAGGTQRLPRLIGVARAKEMILLGRRISSSKALEYGLVHQVVPADRLAGAVDAILGELAGCAPISVSLAKKAIMRGMDGPIEDGLQLERELYDITVTTDDRNEGLAAFADKRPPKFQGR
jgi:3-hydroxyacyl-CoA dehydrogenase